MGCSGISDCGAGAAGTTAPAARPGRCGRYGGRRLRSGRRRAGSARDRGAERKRRRPGHDRNLFTSCTGGWPLVCSATAPSRRRSSTSGAGTCGCAGLAGAAGLAGRGGGASIGVLAHGSNVVVDVRNSIIEAGAGGDGSAGGLPGAGGAGTAGMNGVALSCPAGPCHANALNSSACSCIIDGNGAILAGGGAGGKGGKGGGGSAGGAGAGGWSFAIVTSVGAQASTDGVSVLKHGVAGAGRGAAPDGQVGRHHRHAVSEARPAAAGQAGARRSTWPARTSARDDARIDADRREHGLPERGQRLAGAMSPLGDARAGLRVDRQRAVVAADRRDAADDAARGTACRW